MNSKIPVHLEIPFEHIQSAHCENGVTTNLLRHAGVTKISEPLAFGMGSGLFYIHIPFLKINNGPAISFRTMPGLIFKRTCKALGIPVIRKKFNSPEKGNEFLTRVLEKKIPAGCQVGVYFLPYFPKEYRFHFNAHNIVVFGKKDGNYLVSDPVMETTTSLTEYELTRVRYAKGPLAPNGQIYFPDFNGNIGDEKFKQGVISGIKRNVRDMIRIPGGIAGVNGIRFTGRKVKRWKEKLGLEKAGSYLAQVVRMQEEIGTGGGGFRFIYAAFLQQAVAFTGKEELLKISETFTRSGDLWRENAVRSAGIFKGRLTAQGDFNDLHDLFYKIAALEEEGFRALDKLNWK